MAPATESCFCKTTEQSLPLENESGVMMQFLPWRASFYTSFFPKQVNAHSEAALSGGASPTQPHTFFHEQFFSALTKTKFCLFNN